VFLSFPIVSPLSDLLSLERGNYHLVDPIVGSPCELHRAAAGQSRLSLYLILLLSLQGIKARESIEYAIGERGEEERE
jgi:hypothetical protein